MTNKSFGFTLKSGEAFTAALVHTELQKLVDPTNPAKRIKWNLLTKGWGYDPFLVAFTARDNDTVTFQFVNCEDATTLIGAPHTASLTNIELLFPDLPSTIPKVGDIGQHSLYGFLMLNPLRLKGEGLEADAKASNTEAITDEGKWPRTAGGSKKTLMLLRAMIAQALQRNTGLDQADLQLMIELLT